MIVYVRDLTLSIKVWVTYQIKSFKSMKVMFLQLKGKLRGYFPPFKPI